MKIQVLVSLLLCGLLNSMAYAEHAAPVYDVDSMSTDETLVQQDAAPTVIEGTATVTQTASRSSSLEQRLARLERELGNEQHQRLSGLQEEVQALRAQVEELNHRLQALAKRQQESRALEKQPVNKAVTEPSMSAFPRDENEDSGMQTSSSKATSRADTVETAKSSKKPIHLHEKNSTNQPNAAEEQAAYQLAFDLIKAKKYNQAITSLQKMLSKYPTGQFAANAHYWLGELYTLTGQHEQAQSAFTTLIKNYPTHARVADSELKLGLIYAAQLKWPEAKSFFNKVIHQFPDSPSARLAMEQLKELKAAGH